MGIMDKVKQVANTATKTLGNDLLNSLIQPQNDLPDKTENATSGMYDAQLEKLINIALADGVLSEKSKQILCRKAESLGIDPDEFEMVLEARVQELQKSRIETQRSSAPTIQNLLILLSDVDAGKDTQKDAGLIGKAVDGFINGSFAGNIIGAIGGMMVEESTKEKNMAAKKNIILNYPIPVEKNDVLEFLSYAVPMAKRKGNFLTKTLPVLTKTLPVLMNDNHEYELHNEFAPVWKTKCEQIITKVRLSMKDDPELMSSVMMYANELGLK
jgi:hypothetical protein